MLKYSLCVFIFMLFCFSTGSCRLFKCCALSGSFESRKSLQDLKFSCSVYRSKVKISVTFEQILELFTCIRMHFPSEIPSLDNKLNFNVLVRYSRAKLLYSLSDFMKCPLSKRSKRSQTFVLIPHEQTEYVRVILHEIQHRDTHTHLCIWHSLFPLLVWCCFYSIFTFAEESNLFRCSLVSHIILNMDGFIHSLGHLLIWSIFCRWSAKMEINRTIDRIWESAKTTYMLIECLLDKEGLWVPSAHSCVTSLKLLWLWSTPTGAWTSHTDRHSLYMKCKWWAIMPSTFYTLIYLGYIRNILLKWDTQIEMEALLRPHVFPPPKKYHSVWISLYNREEKRNDNCRRKTQTHTHTLARFSTRPLNIVIIYDL